MTIRALILAASALTLVGCQTTEDTSEIDRAAVILAAVPTNYRQEIPLFLRTSIADPAAIQNAEISAPFLGTAGPSAEAPLICVRVTTGPAAGGQPGSQTVALVFSDGRIVSNQWNSPACTSVAYGPFPELRAALRRQPAA